MKKFIGLSLVALTTAFVSNGTAMADPSAPELPWDAYPLLKEVLLKPGEKPAAWATYPPPKEVVLNPAEKPVKRAIKNPVKMSGGTNVAVAEFIGKNVSQADASIVADFLRTELVNTGLFNVMDRNNMDTVLAEQKFQNTGCTEQQCAVEMGKLLNVKRMLVGSLSKLLDTYYITVNVVDVETGKIAASYDSDAASSRELKDACRKIVEKLSRN